MLKLLLFATVAVFAVSSAARGAAAGPAAPNEPAAEPARAAARAAQAAKAPAAKQTCFELDMPPRLQWPQNDGYCGEESVQMSALYYGAYISQYAARAAGGGTQKTGQLLLPLDPLDPNVADIGRNLYMAADALKLNVSRFLSVEGAAQSAALMTWTKAHTMAGRPVIWGVYISDTNDPWDRYDHIIPVTGYCTTATSPVPTSPVTDDDEFQLPSLFDLNPAWRTAKSLPAAAIDPRTAQSCKYDTLEGGCVPLGSGYGVAVHGIKDADGGSLPVRLAIPGPREQNVAAGRRPNWIKGTVTVSGLTAGSRYRIFRFDTTAGVPTTGGVAALLASKPDSSFDFVAKGATYVWKDKRKIKSNGVAYYRAAKLP